MKLALLIAAAAAAGGLAAYPYMARQRGWKVGEWFVPGGRIVPTVALACVAALLAVAVAQATTGRMSWFSMLWLPLAYLAGGSALLLLLRAIAPLLLVIAPALAIAAALLP